MNVEQPDGILAVRPQHNFATALGRVFPVSHDLPCEIDEPLGRLAANAPDERPNAVENEDGAD
jgi:hypothetical protein